MSDYEKMYFRLFNSVTNVITLLQEAQKDPEEIYINSNPIVLELLKIVPTQEDSADDKTEKAAVMQNDRRRFICGSCDCLVWWSYAFKFGEFTNIKKQ